MHARPVGALREHYDGWSYVCEGPNMCAIATIREAICSYVSPRQHKSRVYNDRKRMRLVECIQGLYGDHFFSQCTTGHTCFTVITFLYSAHRLHGDYILVPPTHVSP